MKKNIFNKLKILFFISVFALAGCTQSGKKVGIGKPFKHNTPLIKTDVKKLGKKDPLLCLIKLIQLILKILREIWGFQTL